MDVFLRKCREKANGESRRDWHCVGPESLAGWSGVGSGSVRMFKVELTAKSLRIGSFILPKASAKLCSTVSEIIRIFVLLF